VRDPDKLKNAGFEGNIEAHAFDLDDIPDGNLWGRFDRPDVVFHLAWEGLPNYSSPHHVEENVPRHYRFLKALAESGCPKVVVTGTCAEYGNQAGALKEDAPARPCNVYALAKYVLYLMTRILYERYKTSLIWVRIFYVMGQRGRASLFDQLIKAIEGGKKSFDLTGGEQLRDYLSVEEVAVKLKMIAERASDSTLINLGSGRPVSIRSLVEQLVQDKGSNIELNWGALPYPEGESMAFWADARKVNSLLSVENQYGSN
jgi:dTDP-6-deoxy-L-talose 4-dehydrogenase (NAD+)